MILVCVFPQADCADGGPLAGMPFCVVSLYAKTRLPPDNDGHYPAAETARRMPFQRAPTKTGPAHVARAFPGLPKLRVCRWWARGRARRTKVTVGFATALFAASTGFALTYGRRRQHPRVNANGLSVPWMRTNRDPRHRVRRWVAHNHRSYCFHRPTLWMRIGAGDQRVQGPSMGSMPRQHPTWGCCGCLYVGRSYSGALPDSALSGRSA